MSFANKTFDDSDPAFIYSQAQLWNNGSWAGGASNDSLTWVRGLSANITFQFPQPAIAFYYYGIMSEQKVEICVDCDVDPPNRVFIGGAPADPAKDIPGTSLLYSLRFDTADFHTVTLRNQPLSGSNTVITLDRIDLEVPTTPSSTVNTTTIIPSSSVAQTSSQVTPSKTPGQSQILAGKIVGGVVGGSAGLLALSAILFWLRRRRWIQQRTDNRAHYTLTDGPPTQEVRFVGEQSPTSAHAAHGL